MLFPIIEVLMIHKQAREWTERRSRQSVVTLYRRLTTAFIQPLM